MTIQPEAFDLVGGIARFAAVFGTVLLTFFVVSCVTSLAAAGFRGPGLVVKGIGRGFSDLIGMSPRRVMAIASLTFKESIRRRALLVFVVFAVLFMFGSWFLADPSGRPDLQVRKYVSFVFIAMNMLVLPVVLLLSCWGLPEDIRLRSLHTVVTKPVLRSEVVLGRMVGFWSIGTLVLVVMSISGYVWIRRQVSDNVELYSRVPVYGGIRYIDRSGAEKVKGINVGDIVETRSFIEGGTRAAAVWHFPMASEADELKFESRFEAFRTHKGDMNQTIRARYVLVNPANGLEIPLRHFNVKEFSLNEMTVPRKVEWTAEEGGETKTYDIFKDLLTPFDLAKHGMPDPENPLDLEKRVDQYNLASAGLGILEVHVQCLDRGQYLGASRGDFFIRMPDRWFATGYFKAVAGIWLKIIVLVMIGVTASCFVKWPVATLLTFTMLLIGQHGRELIDRILTGEQRGGGALESVYRMITHMNETLALPDTALTRFIVSFDAPLTNSLVGIKYIFPDLRSFSMSDWVAKGFDVPWDGALLPALAVTLAYFIPCLLLGYYSLTLRELEAK
jgi:hypothetical protein